MPDETGAGRRPVLVVGRGLIGSVTAARLAAGGREVATVSRGGTPSRWHVPCDLAASAGRRRLREQVYELRPECAVLTHGPSDVTWIERHESEAEAAHRGVAELMAESGVPTILVSADSVYDGEEGLRRPSDPIRPRNAQGRVKATAERALLATDHGLVLRVAPVYGWTRSRQRTTYAQHCLESAMRTAQIWAPVDQAFTPVYVGDVARVLAALCDRPHLPAGLAHLGGPEELSRHEFAVLAYRVAGADPSLVRPCPRPAGTPAYLSLASDDTDSRHGPYGWRPTTPEQGLRAMVRIGPRREVLV